ncbi:glycoside hydrolase family 31 protein [Streptomyces capparidis]
MDARDLVRSLGGAGSGYRWGALRGAVARRRQDAGHLPRGGGERARAPGRARGAEPVPGGGLFTFSRSALRVRVAVGGAVFCGWDGAGPEPSYALAGDCPAADTRASLEPDTDGGWRVVSERAIVVVTTQGVVEFRTPGGVLLRRDLPPRWWDAEGGGARWEQSSELAADADVYGLGGRAAGPRLPEGTYRLWNTDPGRGFGPGDDPLHVTMPVQFVAAGAGCHLVFHDNTWDGRVRLRDGEEGNGSGHDRPACAELRMDGGPLRYWVLLGTPGRLLRNWAALTGRPAVPPRWALDHQHARWGAGDADEVRRVVAGYRERGAAPAAVHLDAGHLDGRRAFTVDPGGFPDLPGLAKELGEDGVRLVSVVDPAVRPEPGDPVYDSGAAADVFCRDPRGRAARGAGRAGPSVFPDFTSPRARAWWSGLYAERVAQGFSGVWHDRCEPAVFTAFGDATLPRSTRHALDGRGGDHREAHNVYGLLMARAGYEGLRELRPGERPFVLSRSGWAGMQRYGGAWAGEAAAGWAGLRASLALVLGLGLCGVPYAGPDVGGRGRPSPELYLRWLQLGAYLPLLRTGSGRGAGREPWEVPPAVAAHARAALEERRRLVPYLLTLAHEAARTGAPYARPVWWRDPGDRALRAVGDAFLLGDALLVAPVLGPGVERREVRLPAGRWYDRATGQVFDGPGVVRVDAPLERAPVLVRAGAVVPVADGAGRVELEVWAPEPGDVGGGSLAVDAGDGWAEPAVERFAVRWDGGRVVVEREGSAGAGYPVRLRGAAG